MKDAFNQEIKVGDTVMDVDGNELIVKEVQIFKLTFEDGKIITRKYGRPFPVCVIHKTDFNRL